MAIFLLSPLVPAHRLNFNLWNGAKSNTNMSIKRAYSLFSLLQLQRYVQAKMCVILTLIYRMVQGQDANMSLENTNSMSDL